jgi:hypothetical protein
MASTPAPYMTVARKDQLTSSASATSGRFRLQFGAALEMLDGFASL